jgi:SAM-dependent methyltransferase
VEDKIKQYYNANAAGYEGRFPLSFMKAREKKGVVSLFKNIKGKDALDLGCGTGFYTKILLEAGALSVVGVDVSQEMLKHLPEGNVTGVCSKVEDLNLGKKFGVLISCGMMEFLKSPLKAFEVIRSHAAGNAHFYLLMPNKNFMGILYKNFHKMHGVEVNLFSIKDIEALALKTSWRVEAKTKRLFGFTLILRLRAV